MDDLQQLSNWVTTELQRLDDLVDLEKRKVKTLQKRKPRTEMLAQTRFSADGPALFMEGPKVLCQAAPSVGNPYPKKLWKQPQDHEEQPSRRSLRLRRGAVPRITSS